jgi:L-threonylcarbamoyladenylate synthase
VEVSINNDLEPNAPGMASKHYSPNTPSHLTNNIIDSLKLLDSQKVGLLSFKDTINSPKITFQKTLSPSGNLDEAAHNLYNYLHELDSKNLDVILIEEVSNTGIGISINDKLKRATTNEKKK